MKLPKQAKPVQRNAEYRIQTNESIKPSTGRYIPCDCPPFQRCLEENCLIDPNTGREHCFENRCVSNIPPR
jgi:hypothetical protein